MKQLGIALGIIILIAIGWRFLVPTPVDHVAAVEDEITQLETELAMIEDSVNSGTLTSGQAVEAKESIMTRLDRISGSVADSSKQELTPSQKMMLENALQRLKTILITHKATLEAVDNRVAVLPESQKSTKVQDKRRSLYELVADAVVVVESYADDVIENYDPQDTEPEVGVVATNPEEEVMGENGTSTATTSDMTGVEEGEGMSDKATSTEEMSTESDGEVINEEEVTPEDSETEAVIN